MDTAEEDKEVEEEMSLQKMLLKISCGVDVMTEWHFLNVRVEFAWSRTMWSDDDDGNLCEDRYRFPPKRIRESTLPCSITIYTIY